MRLVGVLLVSSLIVIPASAMIQLKMPFRQTVLSACGVAVFSVVAGLQLSFMYNLAPGGSIVLVTIGFFILAAIVARVFPKIPKKPAGQQLASSVRPIARKSSDMGMAGDRNFIINNSCPTVVRIRNCTGYIFWKVLSFL